MIRPRESRLSARDRRTVLLGAAIVALLLLVGRGIPAWRAWESEARASAKEMLLEAARAESDAAALNAVRDSLAARNGRYLALAPRLVGTGSPSTVAASLASLVSGAAAGSGTKLGSIQLLADTSADHALRRVGVRGELTGDIRGIAAFLASLERGPVLLAVRELSISQPDPAAPANRAERLAVTFAVEGLALATRREGEK